MQTQFGFMGVEWSERQFNKLIREKTGNTDNNKVPTDRPLRTARFGQGPQQANSLLPSGPRKPAPKFGDATSLIATSQGIGLLIAIAGLGTVLALGPGHLWETLQGKKKTVKKNQSDDDLFRIDSSRNTYYPGSYRSSAKGFDSDEGEPVGPE